MVICLIHSITIIVLTYRHKNKKLVTTIIKLKHQNHPNYTYPSVDTIAMFDTNPDHHSDHHPDPHAHSNPTPISTPTPTSTPPLPCPFSPDTPLFGLW